MHVQAGVSGGEIMLDTAFKHELVIAKDNIHWSDKGTRKSEIQR